MREAAPAGLRQRGFRALGRGDISLSGATHFCQQRQKWAKAPPKTNGFGFPLCRFQCGGKRFCMELTMGLPSLPLTWWAGKVGGSTDIGDYQIAHLPPLAASVGAASWAAEYKKYALLRSAFCKTACQHAAAKPINQRIAARNTGAAAGRDVQAIRCTTISIYFGFRGVRGHIFQHGQARRKS